MASIISAGTTISTALNMSGDTSGNLQLQTQAGANTITVPNATGTMMVSGNMPAFGAYQSILQSLPAGTYTKINFQTEEFDTHNFFDNATNYRFLPTVAGYYQLNATMSLSGASSEGYITFRKNGAAFKAGNDIGGSAYGVTISTIVSLNGSTDYVEVWGYSGTALNTSASQVGTYFNGCLLRPL